MGCQGGREAVRGPCRPLIQGLVLQNKVGLFSKSIGGAELVEEAAGSPGHLQQVAGSRLAKRLF